MHNLKSISLSFFLVQNKIKIIFIWEWNFIGFKCIQLVISFFTFPPIKPLLPTSFPPVKQPFVFLSNLKQSFTPYPPIVRHGEFKRAQASTHTQETRTQALTRTHTRTPRPHNHTHTHARARAQQHKVCCEIGWAELLKTLEREEDRELEVAPFPIFHYRLYHSVLVSV
jgi:hypothetical protein